MITGLAQATFPDGSLPEPIEVVRIAAFLFAAGGETTARLLATSLRCSPSDPDLQERLRATASSSRTSSRRRCAGRAR